jgi:hypothetical protein
VVTKSNKLHSTQEALSYQGHAAKYLISQLFIGHHPHHGA